MSIVDLANRVSEACELANEHILIDIKPLGLSDNDLLRLYKAASDADSEIGSFNGDIHCTVWFHVFKQVESKNDAFSECNLGSILTMGDTVWNFLDYRYETGAMDKAIVSCLNMCLLDKDTIDQAKELIKYAQWKYLVCENN